MSTWIERENRLFLNGSGALLRPGLLASRWAISSMVARAKRELNLSLSAVQEKALALTSQRQKRLCLDDARLAKRPEL
jgi:hypothetical protein